MRLQRQLRPRALLPLDGPQRLLSLLQKLQHSNRHPAGSLRVGIRHRKFEKCNGDPVFFVAVYVYAFLSCAYYRCDGHACFTMGVSPRPGLSGRRSSVFLGTSHLGDSGPRPGRYLCRWGFPRRGRHGRGSILRLIQPIRHHGTSPRGQHHHRRPTNTHPRIHPLRLYPPATRTRPHNQRREKKPLQPPRRAQPPRLRNRKPIHR